MNIPRIPALAIPADLPDHARKMLAHLDAGYSRAAEVAAYDPAEMRRHAQTMRAAGMEWSAEAIEARADIVELDPRLELAGSALVQVEASGRDGTTAMMLHQYIDLLRVQAEERYR